MLHKIILSILAKCTKVATAKKEGSNAPPPVPNTDTDANQHRHCRQQAHIQVSKGQTASSVYHHGGNP